MTNIILFKYEYKYNNNLNNEIYLYKPFNYVFFNKSKIYKNYFALNQ